MSSDVEIIVFVGFGTGNAADFVSCFKDKRLYSLLDALICGGKPRGTCADDVFPA